MAGTPEDTGDVVYNPGLLMLSVFAALGLFEPLWQRVWNDWREQSAHWISKSLPQLITILVIAFILIELLRLATRKLTRFAGRQDIALSRGQQIRTLSGIVNSVGSFVIVFWALFSILDKVFDVNVGPLLASAGIAGLAIGFGAQTLVKDFINGFFILVEDEYGIGDVVKIAGVQGTVEAMTLRRTVLRDANGTIHSVPNSEIHIISNLTRDWAQVTVHVAVDYSEDSARVISILEEVGTELRNDSRFASALVAEPEVPGIEKVDGRQVEYLMVAKVRPGQQYAVQRELRRRIKECLQKNDIKPGGSTPTYILAGPGA